MSSAGLSQTNMFFSKANTRSCTAESQESEASEESVLSDSAVPVSESQVSDTARLLAASEVVYLAGLVS